MEVMMANGEQQPARTILSANNADILSTSETGLEHDVADDLESPTIDVAINNVVCTFSTRCHLDLKSIALHGCNVELKKAQGMVNMKLRKPSATASIWSSGKVTVTGANSEENSRIAARRIARILQQTGFDVRFSNFRIVNVLGTCSLPFAILINDFSRAYPQQVQYEPELHPGATFTLKDPKAVLKIFSTGSVTITAPRVENVEKAIGHIFPLVYPYKTAKRATPEELRELRYINSLLEADELAGIDDDDLMLEPGEIPTTKTQRRQNQLAARKSAHSVNCQDGDYGSSSESEVEDFDSEESD